MINIAIVNSDTALIEELVSLNDEISIAFSVNSVGEFLVSYNDTFNIQIVVLCISLSENKKLDQVEKIRVLAPELKILIISEDEHEDLLIDALKKEVEGFIGKKYSSNHCLRAITEIAKGNAYLDPNSTKKMISLFKTKAKYAVNSSLSPIENQIVEYLLLGKSYKMIAGEMEISLDSVRYHIKHIYRSLNVNNKIELFHLFKK